MFSAYTIAELKVMAQVQQQVQSKMCSEPRFYRSPKLLTYNRRLRFAYRRLHIESPLCGYKCTGNTVCAIKCFEYVKDFSELYDDACKSMMFYQFY